MEAQALKKLIYDDPTHIVAILEDIGCQRIKFYRNRVQSTRPEGDNPSALQVLFDESLNVVIHTDGKFKGDIITLVEYYKNLSFTESIKYICDLCGFQFKGDFKPKQRLFSILDTLVGSPIKNDYTPNLGLSEAYLEEFIICPHKLLTEQGVSVEAQIRFKTGYDILERRLITPIFDEYGNLVSIKGRTIDNEYKEKGIAKFLAYHECSFGNLLYGLYENMEEIKRLGEVIVVEGEKSVQQLWSMGVKNAVALSKKRISARQLELLLGLQCKVTLALDKDVSHEEVVIIGDKFEGLTHVDVVWDYFGLLDGSDSPSDRGFKVWNNLYSNKESLGEFKGE